MKPGFKNREYTMKNEIEQLYTMLSTIKDIDIRNFCITDSELKHIYGIDIFEDLLIQGVNRVINEEELTFIGIKNIVLKEEYRGMNIFTNMIDSIEKSNSPIFIDDIINNRLFPFFHKKGYINLKYHSPYGWKRCMYKLNK